MSAPLTNSPCSTTFAALDPAADVVEVARSRVPGGDIRVGSAEALPFADGEFDAVLAQLVVNLVDDPRAAVREMARVARSGAVVAGSFWDDEEMPLLRAFWNAARFAAPAELAEVSQQARVGLAEVAVLCRWWEGAGLREIELDKFEVHADYDGFDDLFFSFEAGMGESGALYVSLDEKQRAALRSEAHRLLGSPDGPFRLTAGAWTVRGER